MSTICRLCGLPCEHSIDIFGRPNDVSIPVLQYKINQLLGIAVGQCDNLPHSVCLPCDSKLESLWCFRNTCHQVQIQLRKTCKTNSSTIRLTHREKELYSLGPSSSTGLLVHKDNSRKSSDNVSKQESICTNFVSAKLTDDARPTPSVSNSIGTTLIHTPSVNNCISSDDEGDCNYQIEEDDSMSVASEENADCSIDRSSSDRISQTTIVNVSNYNCKDVEVNTSSITKVADDNNPSSTPNEQSDTGIPPSSTSTCSEIVQSFEGHYYRMETDMNSDLLCNRIPYLLVESKMGTNHMIYTVSPDVSKFDSNQDVLLDSGELGLYLTMQKYDFNNFNVVRTLNQWINSLLKGEMSLMPYYFSWLDEKNQPIVGFKCIICKHILNRNRQVVKNHIADHLLWTCPVCGCFFRHITKWRFHFLQHDSISLECSTCDKKFGSDYEKYKVHKRSYYKFECSSCHFKCSDKDTWLVHLKKDRKEHCSSDCGMFYETIDEFQKHVSKLSTVGGYVCGVCGMAYHCEEYLKLHLRVHGLEHGSKTTSTCSLAADSQNEVAKKIDLIINSNADVHFDLLKKVIDNEVDVNDFKMSSMAHGGRVFIGFKCFRFRRCKVLQSEKKFRLHLGNHFMMTCLCKNFFRNLKKLKDHFRQHSFERRMCVLCKKDVWLNTSTEYLEHVSLHQKGRICIHCQSVFPNFNRLRDHARRCHNETKVGSWKLKSKIVCNICGKSIHKEEINHHMQRVHQTYDEDKIKIFICAYCGKEFTNRPGFVLHIRRHMNEKNYKCDICGKTFNRRSSLNKHTLDMHSVKKHVCNECGRCFTYPSAMRDHMRKAHSMVISARK